MRLIFLFLIPIISFSQTRVFYEDCEDTDTTDYFLEDYYGTNYSDYWNELTSELKRSTNSPYAGSACMTYDPWITDNPHAVVGDGDTDWGNYSNFDLSTVSSRVWYFRWYQRWQTNITYDADIENKILYINYSDAGDFVFTVKKRESYKFHITIKDRETYSLVVNNYFHTINDVSIDDNTWHKLELYIDTGTTGNANGSYWFKLDGVIQTSGDGITYNSVIHSNPIDHLTGWPSNAPRTGEVTGNGRTWLDELEIYIDGVPGEGDVAPPVGDLTIDSRAITVNNLSSDTDSSWVVFTNTRWDTSSSTIYTGSNNISRSIVTSYGNKYYAYWKAKDDSSNITYFKDNEDSVLVHSQGTLKHVFKIIGFE